MDIISNKLTCIGLLVDRTDLDITEASNLVDLLVKFESPAFLKIVQVLFAIHEDKGIE